MQGEDLGGYKVSVGKGGHSFHIEDTDSDEKREDRIPFSKGDGEVAVVPSPPSPS